MGFLYDIPSEHSALFLSLFTGPNQVDKSTAAMVQNWRDGKETEGWKSHIIRPHTVLWLLFSWCHCHFLPGWTDLYKAFRLKGPKLKKSPPWTEFIGKFNAACFIMPECALANMHTCTWFDLIWFDLQSRQELDLSTFWFDSNRNRQHRDVSESNRKQNSYTFLKNKEK